MYEKEGFHFLGPGAFKLDPLQPFKPILFWQFSICLTFILGRKFLLPHRANCGKSVIPQLKKWTRKRRFFQCLGHSNWTPCSPLSPFCSKNFQFASSLYWGANSYCSSGLIVRKGKYPNLRNEWERGVSVPGAFKLDFLQPFQPILFWQFSICLIFILGCQFLLPHSANGGKKEITQI